MTRFAAEFGPARHLEVLRDAHRASAPGQLHVYLAAAALARGGDQAATRLLCDELVEVRADIARSEPDAMPLLEVGVALLGALPPRPRPRPAARPDGEAMATWLAAFSMSVLRARRPQVYVDQTSDDVSRCERDIGHHLRQLAEAMEAGWSASFLEYTRWTALLLEWLGRPPTELPEVL